MPLLEGIYGHFQKTNDCAEEKGVSSEASGIKLSDLQFPEGFNVESQKQF